MILFSKGRRKDEKVFITSRIAVAVKSY